MYEELFDKEYFDEIKRLLTETLTDFEKKVLDKYLDNDTYKQMAKDLKCKQHDINSALMRIRRRARKLKEQGKVDI